MHVSSKSSCWGLLLLTCCAFIDRGCRSNGKAVNARFPLGAAVRNAAALNVRFRPLADAGGPGQIALMVDDDLSNLRRIVAGAGTASEIDDALLPLVAKSDPSVISPILTLLNESGDQDGMWSIIHTAESFDSQSYVTGLLIALPLLAETCPHWAEVLIVRLLNSREDAAELAAQLYNAPARAKEAAATICKDLSSTPRFHAKAAPILAATMV